MDGKACQVGRLFKEKRFLNIKYFIIFIQNYKMSPSPKRKKQKRCFAIVSADNDKYKRCRNMAEYYIEDGSLGYCIAHYRQFAQKGVIISAGKKGVKPVCFGSAKKNKFKTKKCSKELENTKKFKKIIAGKLPPDDEDSGLFGSKYNEEDDSDSDSDDEDNPFFSSKGKKSEESESDEDGSDSDEESEGSVSDEDGEDEDDSDNESFDVDMDDDDDDYTSRKKRFALEESFIQKFEANDYNNKKPDNFANWLKKKDIQQFFYTMYYHNTRNQILTDIEDIVMAFDARYVDYPVKPAYNKRITNKVYLQIKNIIKANIPEKFLNEPKIDLLLVYLFDYPSRDLNKNFDQYGVTGFGQNSDLNPGKTVGKDKDYSIFPFPYGKGDKSLPAATKGNQPSNTGGDGKGLGDRARDKPEGSATASGVTVDRQKIKDKFGEPPKINTFSNLDKFIEKLNDNQKENFNNNIDKIFISDADPAVKDDVSFNKKYYQEIFDAIDKQEKTPYGFGFWDIFTEKYANDTGNKSIYKELNDYVQKFESNKSKTNKDEIFNIFAPKFMKSGGGKSPASKAAASPGGRRGGAKTS